MLSKKEFIKYINILKEYDELQHSLYDTSNGAISLFELDAIGKLEDSVLKLLEYVMNDDYKMIEYWLYELYFGEKYFDGCIIDDGVNIDISTVEKLYDYLVE